VPNIQEALLQHQLPPQDLQAIAVNTGPGSFTGIRAGLSCIRTLGQFLDIPVYTFNTFQLAAAASRNSFEEAQPRSVYLNARGGKAYYSCLAFGEAGIDYLHEPELIVLSEYQPVKTSQILYDEGLTEALCPEKFESSLTLEALAPDSSVQMVRLMQAYPEHFRSIWSAVQPFYLQQPSFTLRKKVTS
jgi:tRNA threonylcarbamoyl adenosine modification protein YeaZ